MFGFKTGRCKSQLRKAFSDCFNPLKDELGTVPVSLHDSSYIIASMLAVCESYAGLKKITNQRQIAFICDDVFEEVFRREATKVLTSADTLRAEQDSGFQTAYNAAVEQTKTQDELDLSWLQDYATKHFEPSKVLML